MAIRCAVDTGYGFVKFAWLGPDKQTIVADHFPAYARKNAGEAFKVLGRLDVTEVTVNKIRYQVGKDILTGNEHTRKLAADYSQTDEYLALTIGAMYYVYRATRERVIEKMVVGLPVTLFKDRTVRDRLKHRLAGMHEIQDPFDAKTDLVHISVNEVMVVPQPAGGFSEWHFHHDAETGAPVQADEVTLVMDPGEFTLDWLTLVGTSLRADRCGALDEGMSAIVRAVERQFAADMGEISVPSTIVKRGLISGSMTFRTKSVVAAPYLKLAKSRAEEIAGEVYVKVGGTEDVSHFVLTGGGASIFEDAFKKAFRCDKIHVVKEPMYANVTGFLRMGA